MSISNEQIHLEQTLAQLQSRAESGQGLTEAERVDAVVIADRVMIEQRPQDVSGADHKAINAFGRVRLLAREIAGHVARIDSPEASNPFKDQALGQVYQAERRWMTFLQKRAEAVTLQQLVDRRAELMLDVHGAATGMHLAQRREADMYWTVGQQSGANESYAAAAAFSQDAVAIFRDAAADLRHFQESPTRQEGPLAEYRELEALEAAVSRTKTSAAEMSESGMGSFAGDAERDASDAQSALARFLRDKGVTVPPPPSAATAAAAANADDCDCTDQKVQTRARAR